LRDRLLGAQSSDAATIHGFVNVSCQRIYPDSLSGPDLGEIEIQFQPVGDRLVTPPGRCTDIVIRVAAQSITVDQQSLLYQVKFRPSGVIIEYGM
jgi:hypothetical protein